MSLKFSLLEVTSDYCEGGNAAIQNFLGQIPNTRDSMQCSTQSEISTQ